MSQSSPPASLPASVQVFAHFCLAALGFGLGWMLWSMALGDWSMFGFFAWLCWMGGAMRLVRGFWALLMLLCRKRKEAKFNAKGKTPKADSLANEEALKAKGLLRRRASK